MLSFESRVNAIKAKHISAERKGMNDAKVDAIGLSRSELHSLYMDAVKVTRQIIDEQPAWDSEEYNQYMYWCGYRKAILTAKANVLKANIRAKR